MRIRALPVALVAVLAACRSAINYPTPTGSRYAGVAPVPDTSSVDSIRIVTFNVEFGRHPVRAAEMIDSVPGLKGADIVLLQEMDAPGAASVAHALGLGYVYYPATVYPLTRRDFGDAVLSRWPVVSDERVVLPHRGRIMHTEREAVGVTLMVGGRERVPVRVYSLHLGTLGDVGPGARRDQLRAVLDDAEPYPLVIIGGDFNSSSAPNQALPRGFLWPTKGGPRTALLGRIDHILVRGFVLPDSNFTGTGVNGGASDHRPVWLVVKLPPHP